MLSKIAKLYMHNLNPQKSQRIGVSDPDPSRIKRSPQQRETVRISCFRVPSRTRGYSWSLGRGYCKYSYFCFCTYIFRRSECLPAVCVSACRLCVRLPYVCPPSVCLSTCRLCSHLPSVFPPAVCVPTCRLCSHLPSVFPPAVCVTTCRLCSHLPSVLPLADCESACRMCVRLPPVCPPAICVSACCLCVR